MSPELVQSTNVRAFAIPTATEMEADGTFEWNQTTLLLVEVTSGKHRGLGYGYADLATAELIKSVLAPLIYQEDALSPPALHRKMLRQIRNSGRPGIASMAISAVDVALWDLKAKILGCPLVVLLGALRQDVEAYGSGGFTSYSDDELKKQVSTWLEVGLEKFKIKIGRDAARDRQRIAEIRKMIGSRPQIFVDANGAYTAKAALLEAEFFQNFGVSWFEEPVSSDDLDGLRLMRNRGPAGMQIAAGEYGYDLFYFQRMLQASAVDVLQADATRCGGVTGFMQASTLCDAYGVDLSAHTAPSLHATLCCAANRAVHVEYFFDHARIEKLLFEGAVPVEKGRLHPNFSEPGLGLKFKEKESEDYEVRF